MKWGAKKFENLSVEEEDTVGQLKSKLVPLTGVDSKRQKLMAKGSLLKVPHLAPPAVEAP